MTTLTPDGQRLADALVEEGLISERDAIQYPDAYNSAATSLALEPTAGTGDLETELLWPVAEEMERLEVDLRNVEDELSVTQGDAVSHLALAQGRIRIVMDLVEAVSRPPQPAGTGDRLREALARIGELEAILQPFARIGKLMGRTPGTRASSIGWLAADFGGNSHASARATVGDFLAAHAALEARSAPDKGQAAAGVGEDGRASLIARLDGLAKDAWVGSVEEWTHRAVLAMHAASKYLAALAPQTPEAAIPSGSVGEDDASARYWKRRQVEYLARREDEPGAAWVDRLRNHFATQPPAPQAPVADAAGVEQIARDDIRRRAKALVVKNGWKPGDNIGLHSVAELMTAFGLDLMQNPPDRCGHPDCGCDDDAVCSTALASPQAERLGEGVNIPQEVRDRHAGAMAAKHAWRDGTGSWATTCFEDVRLAAACTEWVSGLLAPVQADAAEGRS